MNNGMIFSRGKFCCNNMVFDNGVVTSLLKAVSVTVCLLISLNAKADALGLFIGAGIWTAENSGDVQSGSDTVDVEEELGFDAETLGQAYIAFEHFIPLIPNLRMQYTDLGYQGSGTLNQRFDGVDFSGNVETDFDLTQTDLIAYWRLLDNVVNLDVGAQVTILEGSIEISQNNSDNFSSASVDEYLPMVYANAGIDLPLTGLSANIGGAGYSFDGDRLIDLSARLNYEINVLGVELGWRQLEIGFDDLDDVETDLSVSGPYLGVNLHF